MSSADSTFAGPPRASAAPQAERNGAPFTIRDLAPVDRRAQLRRTPRLTAAAFRIVWDASPRHAAVSAALQLGAAAGLAGQLLVARWLLERLVAVANGEPARVLHLPIAVLVLSLAAVGVLTAVAGREQRLLVELVGRRVFQRIIDVASSIEYSAFETPRFYDQLQRARQAGQMRAIEMVNGVVSLAAAGVTCVGIAAVLFVLEPLLLALVVAAAIPPLAGAIHNSGKAYAFEYAMTPESRERAYLLGLLTERASAKEVRLYGLERFLARRYETLTDDRLAQLRRFLDERLRVSLVSTVTGALGMGIALVVLVALIVDDRIGLAAALTAGIAMQQLFVRLGVLTGAISQLIEAGMFVDDYSSFLALAPAAAAAATPKAEPGRVAPLGSRADGEGLRVEGVTFTYPTASRPALRDVTLEVGRGEVVALVGENGSGKTTLVKLVSQLHRPDRGRIRWNGADTARLDPRALRSEVAVLFQDYIRYELTARDNVALGRVERAGDEDAVAAAAARVGADAVVRALPGGYGTRLGLAFYGGHELSVGQWQRLALARAFFREGSLLVLDEPTASLDARAERRLFDEVRALADGRGVLLISHRFSSVRSADRIYVLERGSIVEAGSHADLLARGGRYAELYELQTAPHGASPVERPGARAPYSDYGAAR